MANELIINQQTISLGEQKVIKIPVGELPSGLETYIRAFIYRGLQSGPTLLITAGVHGDEINGVEIVRRAVHSGQFKNLLKGTVIAVPLLNIFGFLNFSREVPDGKDVNRSFPGRADGSLAARVAYTLSKEIMPHADFGIDFHTGGSSRHNYPQIRYTKGAANALELAKKFAAPYTIASKSITGSLRQEAINQNFPVLVFEGGESTRFDAYSIKIGLEGIDRILAHKGMIKQKLAATSTIFIKKKSWIRAPHAGMFRWIKCSGQQVKKGEVIGVINDPYGEEEIEVLASLKGHIIGHNNAPVVSLGDALFHIGN